MKSTNGIAEALDRNLTSPNVPDSNLESANVVDVISELSRALWRIAALYECELRQRYDIPADCHSNAEFRNLAALGPAQVE